jgi:Fe-S-cluster containining protein
LGNLSHRPGGSPAGWRSRGGLETFEPADALALAQAIDVAAKSARAPRQGDLPRHEEQEARSKGGVGQGELVPAEELPAARKLSYELTTIALKSACQGGQTVSCKAGCGACCRQLVAISLAEAQLLADVVAAMPIERQAVIRGRFAAALGRLEEAGLLDSTEPGGNRMLQASPDDPSVSGVARRYFRQQIACPFLEDESCSIHPDRPLVCREYHVTSPAADCAKLYQIPVDAVEPPIRIGDVMTRLSHTVTGAPLGSVPLVLALEWAAAHPEISRQKMDGLELLKSMMGEIDKQFAEDFAARQNEAQGDEPQRHEEH